VDGVLSSWFRFFRGEAEEVWSSFLVGGGTVDSGYQLCRFLAAVGGSLSLSSSVLVSGAVRWRVRRDRECGPGLGWVCGCGSRRWLASVVGGVVGGGARWVSLLGHGFGFAEGFGGGGGVRFRSAVVTENGGFQWFGVLCGSGRRGVME
jgi:hypothetical protein